MYSSFFWGILIANRSFTDLACMIGNSKLLEIDEGESDDPLLTVYCLPAFVSLL